MRIFIGGMNSGRTRKFCLLPLLIASLLLLAACGEELSEEEARALTGGGGGSSNPANTTVLVLSDDATAISNASAFLPPFGFPVVDTYDTTGGTPALAFIQNYDAVLFSETNGSFDPVATGDLVADYIDAGGGVVIATASHGDQGGGAGFGAQGRITTSGQSPFNFDATNNIGGSTLGTVYQPGHYIMTNVTAVSTSDRENPTLAAGGTLLADWVDGQPMVAVNGSGSVVGITIWLEGINGDNYDQLIANALAYTAAR